ncbi:MAG: hypothetical protein ACRC1X_04395 [Lactobacillus panisapium]
MPLTNEGILLKEQTLWVPNIQMLLCNGSWSDVNATTAQILSSEVHDRIAISTPTFAQSLNSVAITLQQTFLATQLAVVNRVAFVRSTTTYLPRLSSTCTVTSPTVINLASLIVAGQLLANDTIAFNNGISRLIASVAGNDVTLSVALTPTEQAGITTAFFNRGTIIGRYQLLSSAALTVGTNITLSSVIQSSSLA